MLSSYAKYAEFAIRISGRFCYEIPVHVTCSVKCRSDYESTALHTHTHTLWGMENVENVVLSRNVSQICMHHGSRYIAMVLVFGLHAFYNFARAHFGVNAARHEIPENKMQQLLGKECGRRANLIYIQVFQYSPVARYVRAFGNFREQNEICLVRHFPGGVLSQWHSIDNFHVRRRRLLQLQCGAMVNVRQPMKTIETASAQIV